MFVRSILTTKGADVVTITPDKTLAEAVAMLADKRIGAIVVSGGNGAIDGILSERDIVRVVAKGGADVLRQPLTSAMTAKVVTCRAENTVGELMEKMTAGKFRHLPVEQGGRLAGIISIGDIVKARLAEIEHESAQMRQYIAG